MPNLNLSSFHDYDIRGIYPTEINEEFYYHLGKALALYVTSGTIAVGHDTRLSSPSLAKNLIQGISDYGVNVIDLGQISTEMHNFSAGKYQYEANVIVSASHNPAEYNGAKIVVKGVVPLHSGFGLPELKEFIKKDTAKPAQKGTITRKDIFNEWIKHATGFIDISSLKPLKVVVDAGNGMGGPAWQKMQEILPVKIIPLYLDPDGTFPHHLPDPLKDENTKDLITEIKKTKADIGIAIDGDADRAFFIDESGAKLSGTITTALLASYFLPKQKGYYLYNAICGRIVPDTIRKYESFPVRTRVGHSFIKETMKKYQAIFAGEHSGHFYFGANYNTESSLIAGLILLQMLSATGKKLSQIRKEFDIYHQSGEINFKVENRGTAVSVLQETYAKTADSTDDLDGITFWFADWWFNIRLSKTEPLLRLNIETNSKKLLEKKQQEIVGLITKLGGTRK